MLRRGRGLGRCAGSDASPTTGCPCVLVRAMLSTGSPSNRNTSQSQTPGKSKRQRRYGVALTPKQQKSARQQRTERRPAAPIAWRARRFRRSVTADIKRKARAHSQQHPWPAGDSREPGCWPSSCTFGGGAKAAGHLLGVERRRRRLVRREGTKRIVSRSGRASSARWWNVQARELDGCWR